MKKLLLLVAVLAVVVTPSLAREFTPYTGTYPPAGSSRSDIELEYDGGTFVAYGTSPNWTDETVVNFQAPAGGPFCVDQVRMYIIGTDTKNLHIYTPPALSSPPGDFYDDGPAFSTPYSAWPPADWTTVTVGDRTMQTGDLIGPGLQFFGDNDGIGLAYAYADGNPGHSWAVYAGAWTDDTYGYGYDDGIRLGLNYGPCGPVPVEQTTWGSVKDLFK